MFRRPLLLVVLLLSGLVVLGVLGLAAFPPSAVPTPVERVLPNERFQVR
jgi:hypothetical protein